MSIRRAVGPVNITADDFQFTYKGRAFAVEITELGDPNFLTLFEKIGGVWSYPVQVAGREQNINLDYGNNATIEAAGGARMWIETTFLPWLNGLLAAIFPPGGATQPLSAIEQVDAMLAGAVVVTAQPDGSLKATMR